MPSPTTTTRCPASTEPCSGSHRPSRCAVTSAGIRLTSISSAISPNSPALAACVPRLFSSGTPGGSQSNGASFSSPAEVT